MEKIFHIFSELSQQTSPTFYWSSQGSFLLISVLLFSTRFSSVTSKEVLICRKMLPEKLKRSAFPVENKSFPLNPPQHPGVAASRMNVNLQSPCIHLQVVSCAKCCIVDYTTPYASFSFYFPRSDRVREICMQQHTVPLKMKLWKFLAHSTLSTSYKEFHEIFLRDSKRQADLSDWEEEFRSMIVLPLQIVTKCFPKQRRNIYKQILPVTVSSDTKK